MSCAPSLHPSKKGFCLHLAMLLLLRALQWNPSTNKEHSHKSWIIYFYSKLETIKDNLKHKTFSFENSMWTYLL
jgi:hypothetical protein